MNASFSLYQIISTIGIGAVLAAFIYIGKKLQVLDDLTKATHKIKLNVKVVSDFLTRNNSNFNSSELQSYSPLNLTQEGNALIEKIGFDDIFEAYKSDFFICIQNENPKLKYDVEIASIKSISMLYDKEYMNPLKVFFYNNPQRNIQDTAPTLGVYVRDKYLKEHLEFVE